MLVANDLRREVTRAADRLSAGGWHQASAVARGVTVDVECIGDAIRTEYRSAVLPGKGTSDG